MSGRPPWPFRLALRTVPHAWRASVRQDLADEAGQGWGSAWWCALEALGIALSLHWVFTRSAVMSDIRYAIRSMWHARGFALGAIATFALGIGVNVAVFSAVDRMLFRTLPYDRPETLVVLGQYRVGDSQPYGTVPAAYVVEARRLPGIVDASISTWNADRYRIARDPDGAQYLSFVQVSYNMLAVLGVHPVIGQDFTALEARERRRCLLLSHAVWQRDFAGSPSAIGQVMWDEASSGTAEIVGVLPDDFIPPQIVSPNLSWSGLRVTGDTLDAAGPNDRSTPPFVRLKPGVSLAVAQAQVDAVGQQLRAQQPTPRPGAPQTVVRLVPLRDALFGRYPTTQPPALEYLKRSVKLEFGSLTDQRPTGSHAVRPWIADVLPDAFADWHCEVVALDLHRAFWEKATILHVEHHRPADKPTPDRFARHYADTAALALHADASGAVTRSELRQRVVHWKSRFFGSAWARYDLAVPPTFRLVPPRERGAALRRDYQVMRDLYLSEPVPFERILATLDDVERLVNSAM